MTVIGYLFYKPMPKSDQSARFSLTIHSGRIKEQE